MVSHRPRAGGATCRALVGRTRLRSLHHRKSVGGMGSTKGGPASSVGLQPLKEPDASCPLPNWETAVDPCLTDDWPTLPETHTDQAEEELPGLSLAFYPDHAEDPLQTEVLPEGS